jgi:hypothetical protein
MDVPAALRAFEPGQIRKEAALRIALRCRGLFVPSPRPALPASARRGLAEDVLPFEVVMAGEADRTSNGKNRVRSGRKQP